MKLFCVYLFGTIFSFSVYAQVAQANKGMHLLDVSSNNTTKGQLDLSILDLSSSEKGFLLPRMTTAERLAIPVSMLDSGLAIFNTTIDCIEYYSGAQQRWLSVCGKQEPAVFDIAAAKCNAITVDGKYVEGKILDEQSNLIFLDVNVSEPGTFSASAVAYNGTNKNGYTFSTKGVFPAIGQYRIVLKGYGKPTTGYSSPSGKDTIKFYFNEVESTCTTTNFVAKNFEPLAVAFECNNTNFPIKAEGTYKINVPLKTDNVIKVPLRVTKPGRGKVLGTVPIAGSQTELIQYESVVTDFVVTAANTVQWVTLKPLANTGKPTISGNMKVNFKTVSRGLQEYDPFADATITEIANCSYDIVVEKEMAKFNMKTAVLKSTFMTNNQTKNKTGGAVTVGIPYITPKTDMTANGGNDFKVELTIEPIAVGSYKITTKNVVNGIWFEDEGDVTQADVTAKTKKLTLKAKGKSQTDLPNADGEFEFIGSNAGMQYTNTLKLNVDFVYRPMNMYSIGGDAGTAWHPGGNNDNISWSAGPRMVRQYKHFSWDGVVRVAQLRIIDVADFTAKVPGLNNSSDMNGSSRFQTNLNKADMVFIGAHDGKVFAKANTQFTQLATYIKGNGVVVYGESDETTLNRFYLAMGMTQSASGNGSASSFPVTSTVTDRNKLILGESNKYFSFGDAPNGIKGLRISGHAVSSDLNVGTAGLDKTAIAGTNGNFSYVHNNYGLVVVGNIGFMGGFFDGGGDKYGAYPLTASKTGTPLKRDYDEKGIFTYNSFFLLNLIHWSIDYAQEHQTNTFKP